MSPPFGVGLRSCCPQTVLTTESDIFEKISPPALKIFWAHDLPAAFELVVELLLAKIMIQADCPVITNAPAIGVGEITRLLKEWKEGGAQAADELFALLMPQLRRIAAGCFARERSGHTLQPTALVNEAFLRLAAAKNIDWRDRGHFLALAARIMRRHLIDHSRSKPLVEFLPMAGVPERVLAGKKPVEVAAGMDDLLRQMELESPQQSAVVELKFFLGLTDAEGAEALNMSLHTFQREWYRARKWLYERFVA